MKRVAAPADKRFRRAHISPARRRGLRVAWPLLLKASVATVLVVYGLYRAANYVFTADAFKVERISIAGNQRMAPAEVRSYLEGLRATNILAADLESWRRKLLDAPWVADATVRRVLPGTVQVVIVEREPIGIGRLDDGLYLVDRTGTLIDDFGPNYASLDLPIIDGLAAGGPAYIDADRAALAARVLAGLQPHPELARLVSQIDVSDVRDAAVLLKGDPAILKIGHEKFAERIQSYVDLAPALRERVDGIDYVDLRFDERVYVRPRPGRASGGDE